MIKQEMKTLNHMNYPYNKRTIWCLCNSIQTITGITSALEHVLKKFLFSFTVIQDKADFQNCFHLKYGQSMDVMKNC